MPRAIWNDTVIAETDAFEEVEGNVYFPLSSLKIDHNPTCQETWLYNVALGS